MDTSTRYLQKFNSHQNNQQWNRLARSPPACYSTQPNGTKSQATEDRRIANGILSVVNVGALPVAAVLADRVLSPLVFFPISTHFTAPPEIPSAPTVLQLGSFHRLSRVEPWDLTADLKSHLQTLYAQSFRITLASSVLPRLLAQS
ncbi:hypothetical protein AQUCO_01600172v1 [Aquilegia coerulea]|uniref:Uncharacterized protein n=1 Tax=Aquilegia coerulea TaxID=218851 RepID=A0A2G5DQG9_AQUCA|nr:hypothetical protein AQUCO_01600172v1 [Aquilegia coerulea]